jgi:hypothetical protein
MSDEPMKSGAEGSRPEPGEVARDAAADIGEAVTRVTHAVGSVLDAVGQAAGDALSGLAARRGNATPPVSAVVPELKPLLPVRPGDEVTTRVRLANEADSASEPFSVAAGDLVSDAGDTIASDAVSVSPGVRVVAARGSDTVALTLTVPADAKPGVYRGELRATDDGVAAVPLVVDVR